MRSLLRQRLSAFPVVALLGPRQVGKTTLARDLAEAMDPPGLYLDLENPAHLARLSDARAYLGSARERLVVLDEVHRAPEVFRVLRGIVDDRIRAGERTGQFLILGSASMELLRQSSESLAGRLAYLEMGPLQAREVASADQDRLWVRGGFPPSFLAADDDASLLWRRNFIRTYLERDIPMLGPRVPSETLRRFWTMLAHGQGGAWNAANLARSLAVSGKTVLRYLDLMVDLLLVRRLPPLRANVRKRLLKTPKTYLRDSGIVHALLGLGNFNDVLGHAVCGTSWEGWVIETILAAAPEACAPSYYRTAGGAEVDLVLEFPGGRMWAVEIKRGLAPRPPKGFRAALGDLRPDRAWIVYGGDERFPLGGGIEAVGVGEIVGEVGG